MISAPAPFRTGAVALTEAEYNALPALRSTDMPPALRSWAHFDTARRFPRADTEDFRLGRLVHAMVAGIAAKSFSVLEGGPINPSTMRPYKPGSDKYEAWLASVQCEGVELVGRDEWREAEAMADAVKSSRAAMDVIEGSSTEVSFLGRVEGVECKARVDYWRASDGSWADLKTTSFPATHFARTAVKLHYPLKAAFQGCVIESALRASAATHRWIVVEKQPPYGVVVFRIDAEQLIPWRNAVLRLVADYAQCIAKGEWPGYLDREQWAEFPEWSKPLAPNVAPSDAEVFL